MRDTWQKIDTKHSSNVGMINYPKQLTSHGIKSLMDRAIRTQKLDIIMKKGDKHNTRREWKALHGMRKSVQRSFSKWELQLYHQGASYGS